MRICCEKSFDGGSCALTISEASESFTKKKLDLLSFSFPKFKGFGGVLARSLKILFMQIAVGKDPVRFPRGRIEFHGSRKNTNRASVIGFLELQVPESDKGRDLPGIDGDGFFEIRLSQR